MLFKVINLSKEILNKIYSFFIKFGFHRVGKHFHIMYPLYVIGGEYITIGNNFSGFMRNRIEVFDKHNQYFYNSKLTIGDNFSMNDDCHIACVNEIIIGNNVLIASKVFITDHFHGEINSDALLLPPGKRKVVSKGPVIIEDNVWVGEGVAIMPNVTIGKNCIIGANAVVTKSFPPNSVIAGNPAKLIRTIF